MGLIGNASLDGIDGGASLDRQFPIRPIRLIRLIRPILPIVPKTHRLSVINKKKTTIWSSEILLYLRRAGLASLRSPIQFYHN